VQGILAALYERWHTGKVRLVECSLLETAIGFSSWTSAQWLADHEEPTRQGSRHRQNAPYQRIQTKDGFLMLGAAGEAIWARCAKALGHSEWCEDPHFATNRARMANREALEDVMNAMLTTNTTDHWVEALEAAGVPCGAGALRADVRRPAGAPWWPRAICERPGTGRGAAHPYPCQDRRGSAGAQCRAKARPA
jgi:crotonobetainyl-CoA:carnitine CoA-transferase CaiB-like acyl-CoA transferase